MSAARIPDSVLKPTMLLGESPATEGSLCNLVSKNVENSTDPMTTETSVAEMSTGSPEVAEMSPVAVSPCDSKIDYYVPIEAREYEPTPEEILYKAPSTTRPVRLIFGDLPLTEWELEGVQELKEYMKEEASIFEDTPFKNDRYIVRFLQGNDWDIAKCAIDIRRHIQWCTEKPNCGFAVVEEFLKKGWVYVCGRDSGLRPIMIIRCREFSDAREEDVVPVVLYWLDFMIERLLVKNKVEQWRVIVDLADCSITNAPASILKRVCDLLVRNYRGRLKHMHIINAGFLFRSLWQIVSVILPERTKSKISLLSSSYKDELQASINPNQVEKRFGGKFPDITDFSDVKVMPGPFSTEKW